MDGETMEIWVANSAVKSSDLPLQDAHLHCTAPALAGGARERTKSPKHSGVGVRCKCSRGENWLWTGLPFRDGPRAVIYPFLLSQGTTVAHRGINCHENGHAKTADPIDVWRIIGRETAQVIFITQSANCIQKICVKYTPANRRSPQVRGLPE